MKTAPSTSQLEAEVTRLSQLLKEEQDSHVETAELMRLFRAQRDLLRDENARLKAMLLDD